jgi:hypothetical protein
VDALASEGVNFGDYEGRGLGSIGAPVVEDE